MTNLPDVRPASATGPELRERTLELLEFPRIREALASHTRTPMSHERALALTPVYDSAAVAELQQETAEAALLLEESPSLALSHDPRPLIQRAAVGSALSGSELVAVADGLDAARSAKALGGSARSRTPLLRSLMRNIADLRPLERELRAKLTPSGELKDDASPLLRQLRAESREAYHHASQGMQAYVDSDLGAEVLQDSLYTVRGGRLVLPVKADFKGRMPGIVHGSSDSGATLFIEPFANVHRTNRWREAGDAEQEEARRILQRLTVSVARRAAEAMHALEMVARLDAALAKARYAGTYRGVAVGEDDAVRLVEARHPLLGTAVPVSLALEPPVTVLVVTGPNTGGKTVALKTLGLMALMRQSGLLLPCSPQTSLPLFDGVYADIGDQQSIELAVSTFSSHVTAIAGILAHATPRSLVLFDELGTSTDPEEGAALGCAVAAHLAEQGVPCVVTTHHRPLAALARGMRRWRTRASSSTRRRSAPRTSSRWACPAGATRWTSRRGPAWTRASSRPRSSGSAPCTARRRGCSRRSDGSARSPARSWTRQRRRATARGTVGGACAAGRGAGGGAGVGGGGGARRVTAGGEPRPGQTAAGRVRRGVADVPRRAAASARDGSGLRRRGGRAARAPLAGVGEAPRIRSDTA